MSGQGWGIPEKLMLLKGPGLVANMLVAGLEGAVTGRSRGLGWGTHAPGLLLRSICENSQSMLGVRSFLYLCSIEIEKFC